MADGIASSRTIPELLLAAASRDRDGVWVRADGGALTFSAAAAGVGAGARGLRDAGVRHGALVMVTARTTPPYLICWLALAALGAVTVSVNPRSAPAELAGLVRQTRPRAIVTDRDLIRLVAEATARDLPPLRVLAAAELTGGGARARA